MSRVSILFKRNNKCSYCNCTTILHILGTAYKPNTATKDHKIPISRGGAGMPNNIVLACFSCNNDKGHLTEGEYRAVLEYRKKVSLTAMKPESNYFPILLETSPLASA